MTHTKSHRHIRKPSAMAPPKLLLPFLVKDRKSTRLNSSHSQISYAVFCLKKKKKPLTLTSPPPNQNPYTAGLPSASIQNHTAFSTTTDTAPPSTPSAFSPGLHTSTIYLTA